MLNTFCRFSIHHSSLPHFQHLLFIYLYFGSLKTRLVYTSVVLLVGSLVLMHLETYSLKLFIPYVYVSVCLSIYLSVYLNISPAYLYTSKLKYYILYKDIYSPNVKGIKGILRHNSRLISCCSF